MNHRACRREMPKETIPSQKRPFRGRSRRTHGPAPRCAGPRGTPLALPLPHAGCTYIAASPMRKEEPAMRSAAFTGRRHRVPVALFILLALLAPTAGVRAGDDARVIM